ncbi:hypothetical protein F4808DRAFT_440240 [Astrocystis sublimbata]|nr:hypothetical protein F4808DRAFT_440240 [Astrocystis sublimbata]
MGNKDLKRLAAEAAAAAGERPSKKPRVDNKASLFVRGLAPATTSETLTDFFSQHFPVKHATVVLDPQSKTSRGFGFVTFTDTDDTQAAKEQLNGRKIDGRSIALDIAESRHRQPGQRADDAATKKADRREALAEARKTPKLIIRNLPWSIKHSDQLAALFRSYGIVKFADIPQSKGKLSGFGFVTMRGRKNAEAALEGVNGRIVDGRTVSVDWAVSKDDWKKHEGKDDEDAKEDESDADEDDEDASAEDGNDKDEEEEKDPADDEEDEDLRNFMKERMANLEDEDSDAEEDEEKGQSDEEDEDEDEDDAEGGASVSKPKPQHTTDNSTTLFIRNLPFTTTDANLKSHFEQFGRIRYARVVHDKATDRPAGTGFVCFANDEEFKACLKGAPKPQSVLPTNKKSILQNETADEAGKYTIDGRLLQVMQAVGKDDASRLAAAREDGNKGTHDKDKRRLYLLSEGAIPRDSAMFQMLAAGEVKIRDQSVAQRKKLIQGNPSLHVSMNRLAVRNIPREIDSKALKALAREAVVGFASDVKAGLRQPLSKEENARGGLEDKEAERRRKEKGRGIVKQTKIMFENKEGSKVNERDGAGKSRGYGFIEYTSHRWALMGLRWLNGHAVKGDNGKDMRLIVEFAIENAQVVARRKELQRKTGAFVSGSQVRNPNQIEMKGGGHERYQPGGKKGGANGKRGGFNDRDRERGQARGQQQHRGKDFAVSKGKWAGDKDGKGKGRPADGVKAKSQDSDKKEALQQKIIARKRMTRKKKAGARS